MVCKEDYRILNYITTYSTGNTKEVVYICFTLKADSLKKYFCSVPI